MKAAMNDEMRISETPYCWVVSIKSKENAIPGRTLATFKFLTHSNPWINTHFAKKINAVAGTIR